MWRVRHGSECQVTPSPWSGVSLANTCKKPEPLWEMRNNGREIYQGEIAVSCHQSWEYLAGRNSRVTIGVSKSLFDSVDYNGTMFVDDEKDDDWVRSCSVLSDTFLFIKIGLVWGMLDINNFYILISNRQQNNKACKTTVTHHFFILFSLYSSLNLPIGVYWQMKWIHISEKELKNPQKFDKLIRAMRLRQDIPGYSTLIWEVGQEILSSETHHLIHGFRTPKSSSGSPRHRYLGFLTILWIKIKSGKIVLLSIMFEFSFPSA